MTTSDLEALADRAAGGDTRALARLLSEVERLTPEVIGALAALHPRTGRAITVGITGPPGAGKSSLVQRIASVIRAAGETVGVLAVDPTSPFSGGAVLGDRIRMSAHALDPGVFVRSIGTRGHRGGLARSTRAMVEVLDACGRDWVLIETVGVGQTEIEVAAIAGTTLLVLVPEAGDTIQSLKAGIMEVADVVAVNKGDRPGASALASEVRSTMHLQARAGGWEPPVLVTSAKLSQGLDELVGALRRHAAWRREHVSEGATVLRRGELLDLIADQARHRAERRLRDPRFAALRERIEAAEESPYALALAAVQAGVLADDEPGS